MRFLLLMLLTFLLTGGPVLAHGGEDHGAEAKPSGAAGPSYFSTFAASEQFELLLRYEPLKPGEPAHLRLFIADFATNAPIRGAKLALTVPEDNTVKLTATERGPGEYLIEGSFPKKQAYSMTVTLSAGEQADLLLLKGIDVGKELPHDEHEDAAQPWLTWKTGLLLAGMFLAGMGLTALLMRRRDAGI
ncbi:hypothetical protein [Hymenobacter saemangeumensis]